MADDELDSPYWARPGAFTTQRTDITGVKISDQMGVDTSKIE
jgi:hypothetical protein